MGIELHDYQTTIKSRVSLEGFGVHSGKPVSVSFHPADPDTGIVFVHSDHNGAAREIRALVSEIGATDLCTALGDPSGHHVGTVEHVMAALFGLGIDNVAIEVEGDEMPILDGSAAGFVEAIDQAGVETLDVKRRYIRVTKPVRIDSGASFAEFMPYDGTRFEVEIDFESPAIGRQSFDADIDAGTFRRDIARARTFGFMKDVERLWAAGHALGSSLENSVVIGDDSRVINMEGLRFKNEFVRPQAARRYGRSRACRRALHRLLPLLPWRAPAERRGPAPSSFGPLGLRDRRGQPPRARPLRRARRRQRRRLRALGALIAAWYGALRTACPENHTSRLFSPTVC